MLAASTACNEATWEGPLRREAGLPLIAGSLWPTIPHGLACDLRASSTLGLPPVIDQTPAPNRSGCTARLSVLGPALLKPRRGVGRSSAWPALAPAALGRRPF